jgi:glycosyltransferase involved in cell wall biosynthesis
VFIVELIRFRPSVVHLHASTGASFIRKGILPWISRIVGVPVVIHIHDPAFQRYCENSPRATRDVIQTTLSRASAVVALGETLATRPQVIAPAVRMRGNPNAVRSDDRSVQPASGEPVGVVLLGRTGEHKGIFTLLDDWARLDGEAAALAITRDGEVERARRRIHETSLGRFRRGARVAVAKRAVCKLLGRAQVLVLPSLNEGQPMAVLEAMARGLFAGDVGVVQGVPHAGLSDVETHLQMDNMAAQQQTGAVDRRALLR